MLRVRLCFCVFVLFTVLSACKSTSSISPSDLQVVGNNSQFVDAQSSKSTVFLYSLYSDPENPEILDYENGEPCTGV